MASPGDTPLIFLAIAVAVDLGLGEFPAAVHPVVWMGGAATWMLRPARQLGARLQLVAGAVAVAILAGGSAATGWLLVSLCRAWPVGGALLCVWALKSSFALRALGDAAGEVARGLRQQRIDCARRSLQSLCGRDAAQLDEEHLASGAIESVAENASDSFLAPLCYYVLFGLPGALAYRAVNTLDGMIGYRGACEYLGKAAARLDDLLNYIPARLTALFLIVAGALGGGDVRGGVRIWARDRNKTASPNAGHPMAAMAGLLGVELCKPGSYRLGDPATPLRPAVIDRAWRLVLVASGLGVAALALAQGWT